MLNNDKMIIGYDLSYQYAQISYCRLLKDTPKTFEPSGQARQYNIPTCLFKRKKENQWFLGKEAEAVAVQEEGEFVDGLLRRALEEETMVLEEESFETIALLALFVKRSLHLPQKECRLEKVAGIMFTLPLLTQRMIDVMHQLLLLLNLPECKIHFLSREESIYHYVIHQKKELWTGDVLVFEGSQGRIDSYRFKRNTNTRPVVAFVESCQHGNLPEAEEEKDTSFAAIVTETAKLQDKCVFLLGDAFYGDWCQESLRLLCEGRRVFKGNDLYSKGACFAMESKLSKNDSAQMIFLSEDMLRMNVGMRVMRKGEESYLAILDGGENWYECSKEWDVILMEDNILVFQLIPLDGRNVRNVEIVLDGLPQRKRGMTRLHLQAEMKNAQCLEIQVWDMGFGELEKSTGLHFSQLVDLSFKGE